MNKSDLIIHKEAGGSVEVFSKNPMRYATVAKLIRSIMQDDYIDVFIESPEPITFNLNDRITADGRDYFLNLTPVSKKTGNRRYAYELRFESAVYSLRRYMVFNRDSQNRYTDFSFDFVGNLEDHIQLIITNANNYLAEWDIGDIPNDTEDKRIFYSQQNCLLALNDICQVYGVEYYITKSGSDYLINIGEIGQTRNYTFEYGIEKGLYSLERRPVSDEEVVTRLYGFGSDQNLPLGYRNFSPRLRMANQDYVEDQGLINLFGFVEAIHESDIKPEFVGEVTAYSGLNQDVAVFSCSEMDFDLAAKDGNGDTIYLGDGEKAVVSFLSGNLAGYEFEVFAYDHSLKQFRISRYRDSRGMMFPDNSTFQIQAGDKFTLLNILMPQSYVTDAEQRLKDEVEQVYSNMTKTNIRYVLDVDPLFMRGNEIDLGDKVELIDAGIGVNEEIRIIRLEYDILRDKYIFDLADTQERSLVRKIATQISKVEKQVDRERVQREIVDEGFHVDIRDLRLGVNNSLIQQTGADGVIVELNPDGDSSALKISSGGFTNFIIDNGEPRTWNMSGLNAGSLDPSKSYYVYARTEKDGTDGNFMISEDEIQIDEDDDYYHFLTGVLYKPKDGARNIDLIHGALEDQKMTMDYQREDGANVSIIPVHDISGMSNNELSLKVRVYRNGVLMRWGGGTGIIDIREDNGEIKPFIPFQSNDKIDIYYNL